MLDEDKQSKKHNTEKRSSTLKPPEKTGVVKGDNINWIPHVTTHFYIWSLF